ncbi:MAG: TonB-dependent receptor [Anaerolineae bacterium]|nr:TonB-dependent receptor [Gemmatimonadaceae bacterium]
MQKPVFLTRLVFSSALISSLASAPAIAQQPQVADTLRRGADSARTLTSVEVVATASGQGVTRSANAVTKADLRAAPAGTSALRVIEKLPGVNFQSAEPLGLYEWSNRVTIRGFQTPQIGQTFDGLPLGDMSYGNFNGLGIGRAVDAENINATSVTQGTGALGTASSNNLGGVIQYESEDPFNKRTASIRQMVGEDNARKTFLRADLGLRSLGTNAAVKGFVSFSRLDSDKWKGSGERFSPERGALFGSDGFLFDAAEHWQDHINTKVVALIGAHKFTAYYNFADRKEADYTDLSLQRFRQSGRDWDQFSSWSAAQAAAQSETPDEAYFHSAIGARRDHLGYLAADFGLPGDARLVVTPYFHTNDGVGDWHAPNYGATWSPDPIYFRETQYDTERRGVVARATATIAFNRLEGGLWYESNTANIRRVGWRLRDFSSSPDVDFDNVLRLFFDRTGDIGTTVAYLQNTNSVLSDRLTLTYGAKYLKIDADFQNNGITIANAATAPDTARPDASFPVKGQVLPQFGAVFAASPTDQLFANLSENVNAFPYSPQSGVYNTSPTAFARFNDATDPERATTFELGVRTRRARVEASLAAYTINYRHRLIGVAVCPLTATCVSSFANVGDVSTRGIEALTIVRLAPALALHTAASYNRSTIDDNYRTTEDDPTSEVESKGKDVVDAPRVLVSSSLRYLKRGFTAGFGGRYVDKRYFSIMNDISVPDYTLFDANVGYRFTGVRGVREVSVQLNVWNLFDKSHISTMGTGGFTVTGDSQTLNAGARRLVFFTVGTSF